MKLSLRILLIALLPAALVVLGGCARHGGQLTIDSPNHNLLIRQSFDEAYLAQSELGEYDIVLLDNSGEISGHGASPNKPIQPTGIGPIRQVMRIHLYWRPMLGTTRNPAAINASIEWKVIASDANPGSLTYQGAGLVSVRGSGSKRIVSIREGELTLKSAEGSLSDVLRPSMITGTFAAESDEARVRDTLRQMQLSGDLAGIE